MEHLVNVPYGDCWCASIVLLWAIHRPIRIVTTQYTLEAFHVVDFRDPPSHGDQWNNIPKISG